MRAGHADFNRADRSTKHYVVIRQLRLRDSGRNKRDRQIANHTAERPSGDTTNRSIDPGLHSNVRRRSPRNRCLIGRCVGPTAKHHSFFGRAGAATTSVLATEMDDNEAPTWSLTRCRFPPTEHSRAHPPALPQMIDTTSPAIAVRVGQRGGLGCEPAPRAGVIPGDQTVAEERSRLDCLADRRSDRRRGARSRAEEAAGAQRPNVRDLARAGLPARSRRISGSHRRAIANAHRTQHGRARCLIPGRLRNRWSGLAP